MRIALILLSIVALMFIGSISWSLMNSSVNWTENKKTNEGSMGTDIEELRYKIKTEEKLKELETKYEELARKNGIETKNSSNDSTESGNTVNQQEVPLSGKFLSQVMPTASLTLIENNGIFGLYTFDKQVPYSTYSDEKLGITVIASSMKYDTFLKNARSLGKEVYAVNETKTFPNRSFYLNPPKSDGIVRLVIEYEAQSIAIEVPKAKFANLKNLLLKK